MYDVAFKSPNLSKCLSIRFKYSPVNTVICCTTSYKIVTELFSGLHLEEVHYKHTYSPPGIN